MASTLNAFQALGQIGSGQAPSGAGKKKKSNKKKTQPVVQDAAPGQAAAAPAAAAGGGQDVVEVGEACAILDKAARTFKSGSDRLKLWKDWMKQAADRGSKAISYADIDGQPLDFKQVMLRSRALEITVEGCLSSPLALENVPDLQKLLSTFLPNPPAAAAVATAAARLGGLLADDAQSYDTLGAAQRAVATLVGSLKNEEPLAAAAGGQKRGGAAASVLSRLATIDSEMAKEQGFLSKVSQGVVTKEHLNSAQRLVQLQQEKLELLQGGGADADGASGARRSAVDSVEELRSAITSHLHLARAHETGGAKAGDAQAARNTALAALQREEAKLADQAGKLGSEIRALEAQLSALRSQAAEVEEQRQRLRQRQSSAREAAAAGGPAQGLGGPGSSHYLDELAAADALMAVADPSTGVAASPELAEARAANADGPARHLGFVRQLLGLGLGALQETPQKITLARSRLAQADKLSLLASTSKDAAAKAAKLREEGEKQLGEAMRAAEAIVGQCASALDAARRRMSLLSRAAPDQAAALGPHARELEELMSHARAQLDTSSAVAAGTAAAPPAPPPAAAAQFAAPAPGRAPAPVAVPPPAAAAPPAKAPPAANGGSAAAAPKQQQPARPRPATAAEALTAAPQDGFQQVGGKKGRRPRA